MQTNPALRRPKLSLSVMVGLAIGGLAPVITVVHAQTPAAGIVDPPSRVGRLSRLLGTVSFHTADQTGWAAASLNYPITSGNAFWTQPSSAAEVDVGSTHLALDQSTEFDIDVLDNRTLQATELQGAVFLRVRHVVDGDAYRITTPRGVAVITKAGAYEIVAGDASHPTMVTVLEGAARIDTTNASLSLVAGQTGRIEGDSNFAASVGPAVRDPFLNAQLLHEQQASRAPASTAPPVVAQMTGGYALNNVGSWAPSPQYGRIWYPPVAASWVPYRDGHWGYVAPWGWTWIDDSSWGFAPFHYGRWVRDGSRWGWIPAERAEQERIREAPVYAPALVTFIRIGIAVGGGLPDARDRGRNEQGSVGWIPLGPREAYVPPYRTTDQYARAVNSNNVTTTTNVTNVTTVNNFVNQSAATVVPATAMTTSQPIAAAAKPVNAQVLAGARSERSAPVQPTAATVGVTPTVAKALNIAPAPATAAPTAAPGPALAPAAARPAAALPAAAGNGSVLPVPAALPVLRPPTPVAPAHPQAGGTAVGATVTTPATPNAAPPPPVPPGRGPEKPAVTAAPPVIVPTAPPVTAPKPVIAPPVVAPPARTTPAPVSPPVVTPPPPHAVAPGPAPIVPPSAQPPVVPLVPGAAVAPVHPVPPPPKPPVVQAAPPTPVAPVPAPPPHVAAPVPPPVVAPPPPKPPVVQTVPATPVAPVPQALPGAAAPTPPAIRPAKPGDEPAKEPAKP